MFIVTRDTSIVLFQLIEERETRKVLVREPCAEIESGICYTVRNVK